MEEQTLEIKFKHSSGRTATINVGIDKDEYVDVKASFDGDGINKGDRGIDIAIYSLILGWITEK